MHTKCIVKLEKPCTLQDSDKKEEVSPVSRNKVYIRLSEEALLTVASLWSQTSLNYCILKEANFASCGTMKAPVLSHTTANFIGPLFLLDIFPLATLEKS